MSVGLKEFCEVGMVHDSKIVGGLGLCCRYPKVCRYKPKKLNYDLINRSIVNFNQLFERLELTLSISLLFPYRSIGLAYTPQAWTIYRVKVALNTCC